MSVTPSPMPVRSAQDAIWLLSHAITLPLQPEALAFWLDGDGIGGQLIVCDGMAGPEAVLHVVDFMVHLGSRLPEVESLVVATVRPYGGLLPGDVDRWLEASDLVTLHGKDLIEWYVVSRTGIECPRDLLGEPERWNW